MPVEIINRQDQVVVREDLIQLVGRAVTEGLNLTLERDSYEVDVSLVGYDEITELNSAYRGIENVTDVLSFPMYDPQELAVDEPYHGDEDPGLLGDIVVCMPRAVEQAEEYGHSLEREVCYLVVHGTLHLVGFDHGTDEDSARMRAVEEQVMAKLGLSR